MTHREVSQLRLSFAIFNGPSVIHRMQKRELSIHIIGDAFVDLLCFADTLPVFASDVRMNQPISILPGGSACNTATHLRSLVKDFGSNSEDEPLDIYLQTCFNPTDAYGQVLINHARQHQFKMINCYNLNNHSESDSGDKSRPSTGHCIVITTQGDRSFLTYLGVLSQFEPTDLQIQDLIRNDRGASHHLHLHIAGYFNLQRFWDGNLKVQLQLIRDQRIKNGSQYTTTISLVPQSDATNQYNGQLLDLLHLLNVLIMNEMEAMYIKGIPLSLDTIIHDQNKLDPLDIMVEPTVIRMAHFFNTRNPQLYVVITLGDKGALILQHGSILGYRAPPVSFKNPVDTTGAGDAFAAGFLYGSLCEKKDFSYSCNGDFFSTHFTSTDILNGMDWGCLTGTSCTMRQGASVPATKLELLELLKQKGK